MVHFGPRIVQELRSHHRDIHIPQKNDVVVSISAQPRLCALKHPHLMVERKSENHRSEYVLHGVRNPSETFGNLRKPGVADMECG